MCLYYTGESWNFLYGECVSVVFENRLRVFSSGIFVSMKWSENVWDSPAFLTPFFGGEKGCDLRDRMWAFLIAYSTEK